jgi:UrcA family protein
MKTLIKNHSNSITSLIAVNLFALVAIAAAPGARAADPGDALTKSVAYGDLDLNSKYGAATLYARLKNAARDVCVPFDGRDLNNRMLWKKCYDHALTEAVSTVNSPTLTALHNQITHPGDKG